MEKKKCRTIYKKDLSLSKLGFTSYNEARLVHTELQAKYPEPGHRVRNLFRNRTTTWDVVVKVKTDEATA